MRQRGRRLCLDVTVKRGAECNTDHQFLCVKIRMLMPSRRSKSIEHHSKQFLIFVGQTKVYDTVPREALCCALQKLGVPKTIVDITQWLHEGMKAYIYMYKENWLGRMM